MAKQTFQLWASECDFHGVAFSISPENPGFKEWDNHIRLDDIELDLDMEGIETQLLALKKSRAKAERAKLMEKLEEVEKLL